jgi:hypothetical protein
MKDEVAEWKGRQRAAMAQQLQLEEESLARLEEAAATSEADAVKGSVHGGMFGGSDVDESMFDAPNMVKVGGSAGFQESHSTTTIAQGWLCNLCSVCRIQSRVATCIPALAQILVKPSLLPTDALCLLGTCLCVLCTLSR